MFRQNLYIIHYLKYFYSILFHFFKQFQFYYLLLKIFYQQSDTYCTSKLTNFPLQAHQLLSIGKKTTFQK